MVGLIRNVALVAIALPAMASAQTPVVLKKLVVGLDTGADIGTIRGGALCLSSPWHWKGIESPPVDDDLFPQRFEKTMLAMGYQLTPAAKELFGPSNDSSPYLIAGRVEAVDMRICYPSIGFGDLYKSKGRASIKVTWQIYSQSDQKVVATISTEGAFDRQKSISDGSYAVLLKALEGSIKQLVAAPEFVSIYGAPPKVITLPQPDPILPVGVTDPKKALPTGG